MGIYQPVRVNPNAVDPGADAGLGFRARSCVAQNPTGQWYYVPSANLFVPPYTVNMVMQLTAATSEAQVQALTPGGFTSAPAANEIATFIFTDDVLTATAGYSVSGFTAPFSTVLQGPLTDRSGTVAAGPASTTVMAANNSRRYLFILNPTLADGGSGSTLRIEFGAAAVNASPSIPLDPGQSFVMESQMIDIQAVNIIGPAGGEAFIAKEG